MSLPEGFLIFYQIYIITVMIAGLTGNITTIIAVSHYKKLRTPGNIFILSMSISDCLYFITVLPLKFATVQHKEWIWGNFACTLIASLAHMFIGISILHLAVIAMNRFVHVKHPAKYVTTYKTKIVILNIFLAYLIPVVFLMLPMIGVWGRFSFESKTLQCSFTRNVDNAYRYTIVSIAMFLPSIFIILCYSNIFYHVLKSRRRVDAWKNKMNQSIELSVEHHNENLPVEQEIQESKGDIITKNKKDMTKRNDYSDTNTTDHPCTGDRRPSNKSNRSTKNEAVKLTIMMLCIFLVFVFSILPYFIVNITDTEVHYPIGHMVAIMFTWVNGCLNPVIYCAMNREFQKAFKKMFCSHLHRFTLCKNFQEL